MPNIIHLGFFRPENSCQFIKEHPYRNGLTENFDQLQEISQAPDLASALKHSRKLAVSTLDQKHHPVVNQIHDIFEHQGLTPESYERAHRVLQNDLGTSMRYGVWHHPEVSPFLHALKPFASSMNDTKPGTKDTDLSHHEVSALNSVGFVPRDGHNVVSRTTGIPYQYNRQNQSINFVPHSFATPGSHHSPNTINRQDINAIYDQHNSLKHGDTVSPEDHEYINSYTGDSRYINHHLIGKETGQEMTDWGKKDIAEHHANKLSEIISKHGGKNSEPFHVYTGVSKYSIVDPNHPDIKKNEDGSVIYKNPAFTSSSIRESVSHEFTEKKHHPEFGNVSDVLKVEIPANYKHGMYIADHSTQTSEREYLLDKGHKFHIDPTPHYIGSGGQLIRMFHAKPIPPDHSTT